MDTELTVIQPRELDTADRILAFLGEINTTLGQVYDVADVMEIKNKVDAIRFLTNKMDLDQDVKNRATESQIRTNRRLGELLQEMPKAKGDLLRGCTLQPREDTPTYADLGIEKTAAHRAQTLAKIPEQKLNRFILEAIETGNELTVGGAYVYARNVIKSNGHEPHDYDGNEWYTPTEYIEMARTLMGDIDIDPATCEWAQKRIGAVTFYTKETDGLTKDWIGRVWLNPPYSYPEIEMFTEKLRNEYKIGNTTEAVLLVNNCTDAQWFQKLLNRFPACFTSGRISFEHPNVNKFATRQGQVFFYLGDNADRFAAVFGSVGTVVRCFE